jgi:hypothetical protein
MSTAFHERLFTEVIRLYQSRGRPRGFDSRPLFPLSHHGPAVLGLRVQNLAVQVRINSA